MRKIKKTKKESSNVGNKIREGIKEIIIIMTSTTIIVTLFAIYAVWAKK